MIGAASESIILELRDKIVARLGAHGRKATSDLTDWRIRRVIEGIQAELSNHRQQMPRNLREALDSYWPAFLHQIRTARNEAGHPANVDPITAETVHGSLLIFHEVTRLGTQLVDWVSEQMP